MMSARKFSKTFVMIALAAFAFSAVVADAVVISENFEGSTLGDTAPPTGWSFVDTGADGSYETVTGNGGGLGGGVDWVGASGNDVEAYFVNDGDAFDLTQSITGSFDFFVVEDGNYSGINFIFGDVQGGLSRTAGEFFDMHLREKTFGARALMLDGDGTTLLGGSDNNWEIATGHWYGLDFTWTPTSGTTGDVTFNWSSDTDPYGNESMSYTGYTFNSAEGYFGFGTGKSPGTYDNIEITGTVIPEPASALLMVAAMAGLGLMRRRLRR